MTFTFKFTNTLYRYKQHFIPTTNYDRYSTGSVFMVYKCVIHATLIRSCTNKSGLTVPTAIVRYLLIMPLTIVIEK